MNRLDKIEARANAATEGPWRHVSILDVGGFVEDGRCGDIFGWAEDDAGTICATDSDAEFIAHARTDVPDMAAALRAVLETHQDGGESQGYTDTGTYDFMPHCCTECGSLGEYGVPYPCPTVTAIRQHLGDDQ